MRVPITIPLAFSACGEGEVVWMADHGERERAGLPVALGCAVFRARNRRAMGPTAKTMM